MSKRRKRKEKTEYQKSLKAYRKISSRHVLTLEADIGENEKRSIFADSDLIRIYGNDLTGKLKKNYEQLTRTKRYRALKKEYGRLKESGDDGNAKAVSNELAAMQKEYNVSWEFCMKFMQNHKNAKGLSVFLLTRAEDIWAGMEKVLFSDSKDIHFKKRGNLPVLRAKQSNRGIVIYVKNDILMFKYGELRFTYKSKKNDRFVSDEVQAIINYLKDPNKADAFAVNAMLKNRTAIDTYRPCYASLVCKEIRGRLRVYVQITIEGKAMPKYNKDGSLRHSYGKGRIGADIGTQTYAYTSNNEVGLKNLAERGDSIVKTEREERNILRAMDRSRRATNPGNYNDDGTVKKKSERRPWVYSNHYRELAKRHKELARVCAENRHYSINEDVNYLRSLGDEIITEPPNFKMLQRKAKNDTINDKGKHNRRKRFGRSLKNRCPGYFQSRLKEKFESTGGFYVEVHKNYRASQYDHTADSCIKKKLSTRIYCLKDGTKVQRDWYSSFLLFCADDERGQPDRDKCLFSFPQMYEKEKIMIDFIAHSNKKVMNSGIKPAAQR